MRAVSAAQMRKIERRAMDAGISAEMLMDAAGAAVAKVISFYVRPRQMCSTAAEILLIAGHGNNGGDVFAAACHLQAGGYKPTVWLAGSAGKIKPVAKIYFERLTAAGIVPKELPEASDWENLPLPRVNGKAPDLIVDGLLGIGLKGPPGGVAAAAINFINRQTQVKIMALDLPSGLDADSGERLEPTVKADITVTMGMPKKGLLQPAALDCLGRLFTADIGIPTQAARASPAEIAANLPELITPSDLLPLLEKRKLNSHKGDYGHLVLIAGAPGYTGAAILAAKAAIRAGVGLVSVLTPAGVRSEIAAAVPEAMVHGMPETPRGTLKQLNDIWRANLPDYKKITAVVAGPGLTPSSEIDLVLSDLLASYSGPLLLDADALNVLADSLSLAGILLQRQRDSSKKPVILTPHPGEMARLLKTSASAVQADRLAALETARAKFGGIVMLKGSGTLIAADKRPLQINLSGNPGMAVGGSGDVLAGLTGGISAAGFDPFDAARLGVYLHGCAGDYAAVRLTETAMCASDMITYLPHAWKDLGVC